MRVFCEAKPPAELHDRLRGTEKAAREEPEFEWAQFWSLLRPEIVNLLGAILVSLPLFFKRCVVQ